MRYTPSAAHPYSRVNFFNRAERPVGSLLDLELEFGPVPELEPELELELECPCREELVCD